MPIGIRVRLFFATLLLSFAAFLGGHAYLTRKVVLTVTQADKLYEEVPVVGLVFALALALVVAKIGGGSLRNVQAALSSTLRRARERAANDAPRDSESDELVPDAKDLGHEIDRTLASFAKESEELRHDRDLLATILEGMQEGVLLLDERGRLLRMNVALREMLLLRSDVIGQPLLEVVRHAELKELLDRARRHGSATGEVETASLKPRRLLVRATKQADATLAVFVDVTEMRRLETLRRDFVANVSHELRTPVTSVLSAAETLRGAAKKDPAAAERFVDIIVRNAERLQQLIEDLLDLSRIESKEFRTRPERIVLQSALAHVLALFRERADKRRMALVLDVDDTVAVLADRRATEQIVTNLVDNAVKYCPDGSKIALSASVEKNRVLLRVADDGSGIEPAHLSRLFERFYRVDPGRSRELGGTGLGLSIVRHLAQAMNGEVSVESVVGKGTTFTVALPLSTGATAPGSSPGAAESSPGGAIP